MSAHSSKSLPAGFFREYRLLTTFLALIPSSDFRRGETAGEPTLLFPTDLPIAALINLCLSNGEPESRVDFKNGNARRIATQAINLECSLETPVGSVEALKAWLESNTGAWPLHQLFASYQAERNILLWKQGVNSILWCFRF